MKIKQIVQNITESALKDKADLEAKRKALQDMEREQGHDKAAIKQRKLDLEREASEKGLAESFSGNFEDRSKYVVDVETGEVVDGPFERYSEIPLRLMGYDGAHKVVSGAQLNGREEELDEADLPDPSIAQKTQIPGTLPTYKKASALLNKLGAKGKSIDFGAGLGLGTGELGDDAESFEPYPNPKFKPHYTDVTKVPSNTYHRLVNLNVLNVVPNVGDRRDRDNIVKNIGRVLAPGGVAIITTRGKDVLGAKGTAGEEAWSIITTKGTYQKGFSQTELREYVQSVLGDNFTVTSVKLGPAGVVIHKKKESELNEGAYQDGVSDGKQGRSNPRAGSIYGPETSEYERGYAAGIELEKKERQQRIDKINQDEAEYEHMSVEELQGLIADIKERTANRQAIYDKLRRNDLHFDVKRHTPANDAELKAEHKRDHAAWNTIHQVLGRKKRESGLNEAVKDRLSLNDAVKVLQKYGVTKTSTGRENLYVFENGKRVGDLSLIWDGKGNRDVMLSDLNALVRTIRESVSEANNYNQTTSTSNSGVNPELKGINIPTSMKHPEWKEPTWTSKEIAEKLGITSDELRKFARTLPGFPKKSEGANARNGVRYPSSEVKRWVRDSGIRDIIKSKR